MRVNQGGAKIAIVAVVVMMGAGCKSDVWLTPPPRETPIIVTRLSDSSRFMTFSGMATPQRLVIRSDTEWQAVWAELARGQTPVPAVPTVDFTRDMLIVAALGAKPTGGYGITIEYAYARSNAIGVSVRSTSPGASCVTIQALTQPVDIVRMSRDDRSVQFSEWSTVRNCP